MIRRAWLMLPAVALFAGLAWSQDHAHDHDHHHGHDHQAGAAAAAKSEATLAYEAANARMHAGMTAALTGDPDVDFMQGMIPHHQGAIDMAEIVLKHGKDPETRKLAEGIIAAQTSEIAFMKAWLAKRGKEGRRRCPACGVRAPRSAPEGAGIGAKLAHGLTVHGGVASRRRTAAASRTSGTGRCAPVTSGTRRRCRSKPGRLAPGFEVAGRG